MKIRFLFTALLLSLSTLSVAHAQEGCLDATVVKDIQAAISVQAKDMDQFDRCKANTNTYKIYEALSIVKTMTFQDSALAEPYSQHILDKDFWAYFAERVTVVSEEEKCGTGILAFVYGVFKDGRVHVCPALYDDRITKYERAETMLHEARHFEGFSHVTCSRGPRKGQAGACDTEVGEKGSYAVTVEVLTKMAMNSPDIAKVEKTLVKILALTYANEVFNVPIKARDLSAFYLVDNDKKGYIYSDKGLTQVASLGDANVLSRGMALAVFPADKSDAYTANVFSSALEPGPAMGTASQKYNLLPKDQRQPIIDILNLGYLSASVIGKVVAGHTAKEENDTVVTLDFTPVAAFNGREVGNDDTDSVYVLSPSAEMFRIQFSGTGTYQMTAFPNPVGSLKRLAIFNDQRLALTATGEILADAAGAWKPFAPLSGKKFSLMTRPFLWDSYFEDVDPVQQAQL